MKIAVHISFFYLEQRISYINRILLETAKYREYTDVFIHTNSATLTPDAFMPYINGIIHIVYHDLSDTHPYYLTWKCRGLMFEQRDEYDVFMYLEDDVLVPANAIEYWIKYNPLLVPINYNLGFLRIETDEANGCNKEYITDLHGDRFDHLLEIGDATFCVNNKNPFCAFWIYSREEFGRFIGSDIYRFCNNPDRYDIRELSAVGFHGEKMGRYINTVIPIIQSKLCEGCKIYHMSNNYITNHHSSFATIPFDDAIISNPVMTKRTVL